MKARGSGKGPTEKQLTAALGPAREAWNGIIAALAGKYPPLKQEWKASKAAFGWMCLLKHKERTLLYMTPESGQVWLAVVLGERAVTIALSSKLPTTIKKLIHDARPYVEGRGIRFPVRSVSDLPTVVALIDAKMTPRVNPR